MFKVDIFKNSSLIPIKNILLFSTKISYAKFHDFRNTVLGNSKGKKKKILGMELQEHFSALDFSPLKITFMKMFSLYINFLLKRKEKQNIPGYAATFKIQRC